MASVKMAEICGAQKKKRQTKLTMEQYLDYFHAEKRPGLTVDQLEQIVNMHGFRKFSNGNCRVPKAELVEIVSKLELVDPTRSTIDGDGVTSDAELSFEDVVKDLDALNWHECCVTSAKTLKAAVDSHDDGAVIGDGSKGTTLSVASAAVSEKKQAAVKRGNGSTGKGSSKNAVLDDGSEGTTLSAATSVVSEKKQSEAKRRNRSVAKGCSKDVNLSGGSEGAVLSGVANSLEKKQPAGKRRKVTALMNKAGNASSDVHKEGAIQSGGSEGTVLSGLAASLEKKQPAGKRRKLRKVTDLMNKAGNASSDVHKEGAIQSGGSEGTVLSDVAASLEKKQPAGKRWKVTVPMKKAGNATSDILMEKVGNASSEGHNGGSKGTVPTAAASSEKQQPASKRRKGLNLKAGMGISGGKQKGVISTAGSEGSILSAATTSSEKQQPEGNCESGKVGDDNAEKLE